ncbi:MAG: hypothetical protein BEN18_04445 [Epulopiscium sp. Nuni2H_MBin001]|nr:MAG: hypothetical protein BEN18_04445 [Epulopiscium sp. Nuni2H_MBin001]
MKSYTKLTLNLFCIIFTITTLASIAVNLPFGRTTDTYSHILDRAVLCLIASIVVNIILNIKFKSKIYEFIVPYIVFISLALFYIFLSGFWQELHPNAYRDIFINDTIAYIVIFPFIKLYYKKRR